MNLHANISGDFTQVRTVSRVFSVRLVAAVADFVQKARSLIVKVVPYAAQI
jgi:hypothetical protein